MEWDSAESRCPAGGTEVFDSDFEAYAAKMLAAIDDVVLGRVMCELFAKHWPARAGRMPRG